MNERLLASYEAARNAGVPLVVLRTPDPSAAINALSAIGLRTPTGMKTSPQLRWDAVTGLVPLNTAGQQALSAILAAQPKPLDQKVTVGDVNMLSLVLKAPAETVIYMSNAHRFWGQTQSMQAIWNLRDHFKANSRMLVMLTPAGQPPAELQHDVVVFDEPLPSKDALGEVVANIFETVGQKLDDGVRAKAVEALSGLAHFPAEQLTAMSISLQGLDVDALWERKRQTINDTPGLRVIEPSVTFADIGGNEAIKNFFRRMMKGKAAPTLIVVMDEIGDMFAGVGTDTSGVSTKLHGLFLTHLSKSKRSKGMIELGHPGTGKTAVLEAVGAEFGIPMIALDFSTLSHSHVGESEARAVHAFNVIDAVSGGRALYVGTANSVENMTPQLQRRFNDGRFFFDLPTAEEKKTIWPIYIARPHPDADGPLTAKQTATMPNDTDWTGDEIRQCASKAWSFNITLREAAKMVVPVAQSNPEAIDERRQSAANRYLSAAYEGTYQLKGTPVASPATVPVVVVSPRAIGGMSKMKES